MHQLRIYARDAQRLYLCAGDGHVVRRARLVGQVVIDDLHVGTCALCGLECGENLRPLQLIDRSMQAEAAVPGSGDKVEHTGQQVARQPCIGGRSCLIEGEAGEAPVEGLRGDGTTIEMHVVGAAYQRLGSDVDAGRCLFRQCPRRTIHRDHTVAVLVTGLRRIVRPLKGLERVLMAVRVFDAGGWADTGEGLVAA